MGIPGFMIAAAQQRRPQIPAEPPPQPNPRPARNQAGHRHNPHDQFVPDGTRREHRPAQQAENHDDRRVPDVDEPQPDDRQVPSSR